MQYEGAKKEAVGIVGAFTRLIVNCIIILGVSSALAGISYLSMNSMPEFADGRLGTGEITLEEAQAFSYPVWIDARSSTEYAEEHLQGAILLNEDAWSELLPGFLVVWREQDVVVYCNSMNCNAARAIARRLRSELEVPDVHVLQGGWQTIKESDLPLEKGR